MATQPKHILTPDEYLMRERAIDCRSEYINGEVFAMAGASKLHNDLLNNLSDFLTSVKLRVCSCAKFNSDMKVYLRGDCVYCYPDLSICCEPPIFYDESNDVLMNPTIVFEVVSPSTMAYDLGDKSYYYRRNSSLRHVALIWHGQVKVTHWVRQEDQSWSYNEIMGGEHELALPETGVAVPLNEIYDGVSL